MKIKLFYTGIFALALLTGRFSVIPFSGRPVTGEPVTIVQQTELPEIPAIAQEQPEIFDVDNFFDEWPDSGIEMLETGKGHRLEDVPFKSGEKLLGLYFEDRRSFLKNSAVRIAKDDEGWKNISVNNKTRPRFLLKGSKTFREGNVTTLFIGFSSDETETGNQMTKFEDLRDRQFHLGDTTYSFNIKKGLSSSGKNVVVLELADGETAQIVYVSFYGSDEPYLWNNLLWAGDIDHDNKLDFYMEFFNEKGSYATGLFLSSKAAKGKLVKLVGGFSTLGC